jgi:hypothetical protein
MKLKVEFIEADILQSQKSGKLKVKKKFDIICLVLNPNPPMLL